MNRDFKKEIRGKKSKFCLLELSISPRIAIMDHIQEEEEEEEEEDRAEGEVADEVDSPRMTKTKKRKNRLTSQK